MVSRRQLVFGAGALLAAPQEVAAGIVCRDFPGFRQCSVGVQVGLETARQRCPEWCWAACVEAIFGFHGYRVPQERIVEKAFGGDICRAAIGPQIAQAIEGSWRDERGRSFDATVEVLWDAQFRFGRPDAIIQAARELEADNPLILGALGHATVLTAMTYSGNGFAVQLNELIVRDPWPGNPNRRTLTLPEALATQFLAKVAVS